MEDVKIIELYFERNQNALVETQKKYGNLLFSIARNILKNNEDSEEIVNDTYNKSWEKIPPDKPNVFAAYLGRITRNLSINLYNKKRAKIRYDKGDVMLSEISEFISSGEDVEKESSSKEISKAINDWLETLIKDDRVLFVKRYWFCQTLEELANECNCTVNSLSGRLYRLRNKLKTHLLKEGITV